MSRTISIHDQKIHVEILENRPSASLAIKRAVGIILRDSQSVEMSQECIWTIQVLDNRAWNIKAEHTKAVGRIEEQERENLDLGVMFIGGSSV